MSGSPKRFPVADGFAEGVLLASLLRRPRAGEGVQPEDAALAGLGEPLRAHAAAAIARGRGGVVDAGARLHPGLTRAQLAAAPATVRALLLPQLGPRARSTDLAVAVPRRGFRVPPGLANTLLRLLRDDPRRRAEQERAQLAAMFSSEQSS